MVVERLEEALFKKKDAVFKGGSDGGWWAGSGGRWGGRC